MSEQAVAAKADMEAIRPINVVTWKDKLAAYKKRPLSMFLLMAVTVSAVITVGVLGALVIYILANGIMNLSPELFAWKYTTENVSMLPAIINTFLMTALSLLIAVPIGICSAIYLVEYAKRGNKLVSIVRITTETLSGIPSIVYGLFGYLMFVIAFGWGLSFFGGALTLSIMVLPTIMRTTEEALLKRTGFLPGRKLRTWSRQSCGRYFRLYLPICGTRYSIRSYPGNRTYRRRDGSFNLYIRYNCRDTKELI